MPTIDNQTLIKPNATSTLAMWLSYLEHLHNKPIELGLSRIKIVAEKLDLLKPEAYVFTVAGTNGKGTTCRTLEMILIEAGYNVGVYSSPHLLKYAERVRIQNNFANEQQHVQAFDAIENARGDVSLTYFEFSTLAALLLFKWAALDVIILEVGLGGRLDATNIIDTDLAVVTSIALDHTDWLGNTRESIGREKAGVFRTNVPAVVGEPDMPESIADVAHDISALLYPCQPNKNGTWSYSQTDDTTWCFHCQQQDYVSLPVPAVPLMNAATALAALSYSSLSVSEQQIRAGLNKAALPGRFQIISEHPLLVLDVAHNPHAAIYLKTRLNKVKASNIYDGKLRIVIGMLHDKDIHATLEQLTADVWYCASLYGPRGASSEQLAQYLPTNNVNQFTTVVEAWRAAMAEAKDNDIVVVCGSFHTVAEVMSEISNEQ